MIPCVAGSYSSLEPLQLGSEPPAGSWFTLPLRASGDGCDHTLSTLGHVSSCVQKDCQI